MKSDGKCRSYEIFGGYKIPKCINYFITVFLSDFIIKL